MQLLVELPLGLCQQCFVVDGIVLELDLVENGGSGRKVVFNPAQPQLHVAPVWLRNLHTLRLVWSHYEIVYGLHYLLSQLNELAHPVLAVVALHQEKVTIDCPFSVAFGQVGVAGQGFQRFGKSVDVAGKPPVAGKHEAWLNEIGIDGEHTFAYLEPHKRHHIRCFHLLQCLNGIDVVWPQICHTVALEGGGALAYCHREIVGVAEEHWDGNCHALVGIGYAARRQHGGTLEPFDLECASGEHTLAAVFSSGQQSHLVVAEGKAESSLLSEVELLFHSDECPGCEFHAGTPVDC